MERIILLIPVFVLVTIVAGAQNQRPAPQTGTFKFSDIRWRDMCVLPDQKNLFRGSQAPWGQISGTYGCYVTDGPFLYPGKTGKLSGPWRQQEEAVYKANGGHGMLFKTFNGKLMMILHLPYNGDTRPHLFEMEDTGETLKIVKEITAG